MSVPLGSSNMVSRHIFAIAAFAALIQFSCSSQKPASMLVGRWQSIQPPDKAGEVLDLDISSGRWRAILNGLERAGEHGLFYYVVEPENLAIAPDGSITFDIGERFFFRKRPPLSQRGGRGDSGVARSRMRFAGRIEDGDIVLLCNDDDGSCPDSVLRFKKLTSQLEPRQKGLSQL